MDRVNQLRDEAGGSRDSSLDSSSTPSDSFHTANDSSKYFSTFDLTPIKDVSLASTADDQDKTITGSDHLLSDLSSISKKNDLLDSYKIGEHIEAANILSGGVDIFDDNDNSYDNDLVIDDNVGMDLEDDPNSQINKLKDQIKQLEKVNDPVLDSTLTEGEATPSVDSGVSLQIDGKNVDAIDIGNGLYLYRTEGDQLAAVQIIENEQNQTEFKFLKVRPNAEGNLEVYEEFEIEVPSDAPRKDKSIKTSNKTAPSTKPSGSKSEGPPKQEDYSSTFTNKAEPDSPKDGSKCMKFNESRKSPLTFHSTPTKEGIPLTKSMVDKHLDPNRHAENKKTIEVKSDHLKQKLVDKNTKYDITDTITKDEVTYAPKDSTEPRDEVSTGSRIVPTLDNDDKVTENIDKVPKPDLTTPKTEASTNPKDETVKLSDEKQADVQDATSNKTSVEQNIEATSSQLEAKVEEKNTSIAVIENVLAPAVISTELKLDSTADKSEPDLKSSELISKERKSYLQVEKIKIDDSKASTSIEIRNLKSDKQDIAKDEDSANKTENAPQVKTIEKPNKIENVAKTQPAVITEKKSEHNENVEVIKSVLTIGEPKPTEVLVESLCAASKELTKNTKKPTTRKVDEEKLTLDQTNYKKESDLTKDTITTKPTKTIDLTEVKEAKPESKDTDSDIIDTKSENKDTKSESKDSNSKIKDTKSENKNTKSEIKDTLDLKDDKVAEKKTIQEPKRSDVKLLQTDEVDSVLTVSETLRRMVKTAPEAITIHTLDKNIVEKIADNLNVYKPKEESKTTPPKLVSQLDITQIPQVTENKSPKTLPKETKLEAEFKIPGNPQEKLPEVIPKHDKSKEEKPSQYSVSEIKESQESVEKEATKIPALAPEKTSTNKTELNLSESKPQITQMPTKANEDTSSKTILISSSKPIVIKDDEKAKAKPKLVESVDIKKKNIPLDLIQRNQDKKDVKLTQNAILPKSFNPLQAKATGISDTFKNISQIKPLTPVDVTKSSILEDKNATSVKLSGANQSESLTQPSSASCDLINLDDLGVTKKKVETEKIPHYMQSDFGMMSTHKNIVSIGKAQSDIKSSKVLMSPYKSVEQASLIKHDFQLTPVRNPTPTKTLLDEDFINECVSKAAMIRGIPLKGDSKMTLTSISSSGSSAFHPVTSKTVLSTVKPVDKKDNTLTATKDVKSLNNNNAVPFGKWTEANKQAYLHKIKECKVPTNSANANQIKQPNDLNRRDVLKKIDSQRQSSINASTSRLVVKTETVITKVTPKPDTNMPVKAENPSQKTVTEPPKPTTKTESQGQTANCTSTTSTADTAPEQAETKTDEISFKSLIDRTIEDILMDRKAPSKNLDNEWNKEGMRSIESEWQLLGSSVAPKSTRPSSSATQSASMKKINDDLEMKLSELHGMPFGERIGQDSSHKSNCDFKVYSKPDQRARHPTLTKHGSVNEPNVKSKPMKCTRELDSDEEIIEHVPVTGDIEMNKRYYKPISAPQRGRMPPHTTTSQNIDLFNKDSVMTEMDFDKFGRGNSNTYEHSLTVNFEEKKSKSGPIIISNPPAKLYSKNINSEGSILPVHRQQCIPNPRTLHPNKMMQSSTKCVPLRHEDVFNRNPQNKIQIAYNSALTAKRQKESPITVIEDKPVKVIYMDNTSDFVPSKLNAQGQELSPAKKYVEPETVTLSSCDSIESETTGSSDQSKIPDAKKNKHQRKQVLTPTESPLEVVEPNTDESPKKKRKVEEIASTVPEKSPRSIVPKKSYLLGRTGPHDDRQKEQHKPVVENVPHIENTAASAIDSLVKAAELLDNQSLMNKTQSPTVVNTSVQSISSQGDTPTPIKRGRGRPRKYPLPEGVQPHPKTPSPAMKRAEMPRTKKKDTSSEDSCSDDEMIQENWSMGKINENIVCPICNKLFRSENVVFKHVKHCTGPSPNRSESDKSSRNGTDSSQDSRDSMFDKDYIPSDSNKSDKPKKTSATPKSGVERDSDVIIAKNSPAEVIVIEDTPIKERTDKDRKICKPQLKATLRSKFNHVCDICGKEFRQLSYLISHKLQHKNDPPKTSTDTDTNSTVFTCEICKKDFRKLHYLVQHRIIHNPTSAAPSRLRRKSSVEQNNKDSKQVDDQSAGFRCEPCDKSFRKLHHLVEHRETHDGINRQKTTTGTTQPATEKTEQAPPECDVCQKTFRKLHHLVEHKEQHAEQNKNDDKNRKPSLSLVKDIIHECSLCYMVFPNEHSLNKHAVICARKKKQSESKQNKSETEIQDEETKSDNNDVSSAKTPAIELQKETSGTEKTDNDNKTKENHEITTIKEQTPTEKTNISAENVINTFPLKLTERPEKPHTQLRKPSSEKPRASFEDVKEKSHIVTKPEAKPAKAKRSISEDKSTDSKTKSTEETPAKIRKSVSKDQSAQETPQPKISKTKNSATVTKKHKSINAPLPVISDVKPQSSDEEDVRYMLNPNFKEYTSEKTFMQIIAKKRNSLQIERPKDQTHVKRRISLQHHPKIPRAKTENKQFQPKFVNVDTVPSTDSDDSDVKYSFPDKTYPAESKDLLKIPDSKPPRKSMTEKRKTLSGIAKRKSIGKGVMKQNEKTALIKMAMKKRMANIEHRCDCGQLFNSAALLARHTSLAHTPPRIRRRRSAQQDDKPIINTKTITNANSVDTIKKQDVPDNKKPKLNTQKKTLDAKKRKLELAVDAKKKEQESEVKKVKSESKKVKGKEVKKSKVPTLADIKRAKTRTVPEVKAAATSGTIEKTSAVIQKPKTATIVPAKRPKYLPAFTTNKAKRELLIKTKATKDVTVVKKSEINDPNKAKENVDSKPVRRSVGRPPKFTSSIPKPKVVVQAKSNVPSVDTKPKRTPKKTSKVIEGEKINKARTSSIAAEKRKTIDVKSKK